VISEMLAVITRQQSEMIVMAASAAMWQTRAEMLADQLDQAQRALQAPQPEPVPTEPTPVVEAVSAPAVRPWWRFWGG